MNSIEDIEPALAELRLRRKMNLDELKDIEAQMLKGLLTGEEYVCFTCDNHERQKDLDAELLSFRDKRQNIVNSPTHLYVTGV
tara:strand:- start:83 stop:331 length:249 start_codon:yes stop_codon:yes gene_type:complete